VKGFRIVIHLPKNVFLRHFAVKKNIALFKTFLLFIEIWTFIKIFSFSYINAV